MTQDATLQDKATPRVRPYDEYGYAKGYEGQFDFGHAIRHLKTGSNQKVQRKGWNGRDMFVYLRHSSGFGEEDSLPTLMLHNAHQYQEAWSPTAADALANDWQYYPGPTPKEAPAK
ncbi:MAG: DUF2829 domain-containing protein [Gammaproteobacteria bacterium]|nr:DUF2829 domain-containing protein [Gammaproteobacteria bacterium]